MFSVPSALLRVSQQQGFASPGGHVSEKAVYHLGVEVGRWQHPVTGPLFLAHPVGLSPSAPETMLTSVPLEGTSRALKPGGVLGTFCSIFLSEPAMCGRQTPHGRQNHPLGYQQPPVLPTKPLCRKDTGHRPAQSMSSPPKGRLGVVLCPGCTAGPSVLTARSALRWRQSAARISSVLINSFAFVLRCCFRRCQSLCGG